jgi:general secretion pathway protein G
VSRGWRRRQLVVRGFQRQFVLHQLAWLIAYLLVFAAVLLVPIASRLDDGNAEQRLQAAAQFLFFHQHLWTTLGGVLIVAAVALIKASHRIAGPLYRFRSVFEAVAAGDLTVNGRVRRGDYLSLESDALQAMLASLRDRIGEAQRAVGEAEIALGAHGASGADSPGASPDLDAAARAIATARRSLTAFIVHDNASHDAESRPSSDPAGHAGFTIVEILVVSAMIGILAAIAVPAYQQALAAARVAKAVGDIKTIDKEIQMHFMLEGCLPGSLSDIGRDQLRDPWGNPYSYQVLRSKSAADGGGGGGNGKGKGGGNDGGSGSGASESCAACNGQCVPIGQARKDHNLVPINSSFDLFSMGPDGRSTGPLTAKASRDDIIRGSDGAFVGPAKDY